MPSRTFNLLADSVVHVVSSLARDAFLGGSVEVGAFIRDVKADVVLEVLFGTANDNDRHTGSTLEFEFFEAAGASPSAVESLAEGRGIHASVIHLVLPIGADYFRDHAFAVHNLAACNVASQALTGEAIEGLAVGWDWEAVTELEVFVGSASS